MSGSRPSPEPSRPAWSMPARGSEAPPPAAPDLDDARFEPGPDLGVGGMGRVRLVRDRWLGRQVAMKEPVTELDASRLWHEALVTARLEHPGIVAVHDLGVNEHGVPWFAMRVVRGRSLAELLRASPLPSERQAFLRPLLAAAEAVGFAHREGVVHRDLKPSNLMIGAFGEMQVIDWGLARAEGLPDHDLGSAGTLGYMSPEQARGEPATPASDVWSLGAVLFEVATGAPLRSRDLSERAREFVASGQVPALPDDVPTELAAIIRRATATSTADRYPDAKALALDLERYLDGRRVEAHSYSSFELLRRLVRAWRVPLAVLAAALIVLAIVIVIGVGQVRDERDRANANLSLTLVREAQRMAEDLHFGEAELLASAALSNATDARIRAEARGVLAALGPEKPSRARLAELPCAPVDLARDLALCRDATTLRVFERGELRFERAVDQRLARFVDDGAGVVAAGDTIVLLDGGSGEIRREIPNPCAMTNGMRLDRGSTSEVFVSSPHCMARITLDGVTDLGLEPCARGVSLLTSTSLGTGRVLGACSDGTLTRVDFASAPAQADLVAPTATSPSPSRRLIAAGFGTVQRPPVVTAIASLGGHDALIGFGDGGVSRVTLSDVDLAPAAIPVAAPNPPLSIVSLAAQSGLVRTFVPFADGRRALVLADASAPLVVDLERGVPLLRLPRLHATAAAADGASLVLGGRSEEGGEVERWELADLLPRSEPFPGGVTIVAARRAGAASPTPSDTSSTHAVGDGAPDPSTYAVGDGGTLVLLDTQRRRVAAHQWQDSIIKTATFAPDGALVAHGLGRPELRRFAGATELPAYLAPKNIVRRVVAFADGSLLVSSHTQLQFRVRMDGPPVNTGSLDVIDLATDPEGRHLVVLVEGGEIRLGRDYPRGGSELTRLPVVARDRAALAVALHGQRLFALAPDGVRSWVLEPDGARAAETFSAGANADLVSLAASEDVVAAGARDGTVRTWPWTPDVVGRERVQPSSVVRLHHGRVDSLAFGAGRWREGGAPSEVLVTGSWDRSVSWIDPRPRETAPSEVERRWGIVMDDVFSGAR